MENFVQTNSTTTLPIQGTSNSSKFVVKPTKVTPGVKLMPAREYLVIKGRSSPSDALGFYRDVYQSVAEYQALGKKSLTVCFQFEYFNTSSAKCIFNLLKLLDTIENDGVNIQVKWYYEDGDDDMFEVGEDFSSFFDLSFNLIPLYQLVK